MFGNLLVQHLVRKAVLVDAVNEICLAYVVHSSFTTVADNSLLPNFAVLHYFL